MKRKLTDKLIKGMRSPEQGQVFVWDSTENGFGLRITAAGKKSFVQDYRNSGGIHRRYTIGSYPDLSLEAARNKGEKLRTDIREGYDPIAAREDEKRKQNTEPTLGDLVDDYMASEDERKKRPSSQYNDRSMVKNIIHPRIGQLRLKEVKKHDIENLKRDLESTPYRANRTLALLSAIFNYGIEHEWTDANPARKVKKFEEEKRECFLTVEEMGRLKHALDNYADQSAANAIRLLMLTGSREMEVLKADWKEFDLERGTWKKPSHHTKQKKVEHIPLGNDALELLTKMAPINPKGPLFPGRKKPAASKGKIPDSVGIVSTAPWKEKNEKPRTTLKRPWTQVCKAAGLTDKVMVQGKKKMIIRYKPTVRIHDLRHNYASVLASANISLQKIGQLIGHTQTATTQRYAHLHDQAQRDATNVFGAIYANARKSGSGTAS